MKKKEHGVISELVGGCLECSNVPDLTATIHEDDSDNTDYTVKKLTNIVELDENQKDVDESLPSTSH